MTVTPKLPREPQTHAEAEALGWSKPFGPQEENDRYVASRSKSAHAGTDPGLLASGATESTVGGDSLTSNLVSRLRKTYATPGTGLGIISEAADEIERLEKEKTQWFNRYQTLQRLLFNFKEALEHSHR